MKELSHFERTVLRAVHTLGGEASSTTVLCHLKVRRLRDERIGFAWFLGLRVAPRLRDLRRHGYLTECADEHHTYFHLTQKGREQIGPTLR